MLAHLQVLEQIPESADFVLLGEASHGTHEFYQLRGDVTKLLIQERGFNAVATEAGKPQHAARASTAHTYMPNVYLSMSARRHLSKHTRHLAA